LFAMRFRLLDCHRALPLILSALLFSGCTTAPAPEPEAYRSGERLIQLAEQDLEAARDLPSPLREQHLVRAAGNFIAADRPERAEAILQHLKPALMPPETLADYSILYSRLALADDRFFLARNLLGYERLVSSLPQLPVAKRMTLHQLRADLFSLLGEEQEGVAEYRQLAALSTDPMEISAIHDKLWQALGHIPRSSLENLAATSTDPELQGWYKLALLTRQNTGDIRQQFQQVKAWESLNPNHAAAKYPPTTIRQIEQAILALPARIALLLPLSGEFSTAANTVRDGFLAAYYRVLTSTGQTPEVRIYDTESGVVSVYNEAIAEGAQMVIGPLRKEDLAALAGMTELPVPVIGLNYMEDDSLSPPGLYQFGLSIADEARQAADRAWIEGRRTALSVTPDTSWGQSAIAAFRDDWQQRGGTLIETPAYPSELPDFSPVLRPALLLDQSEERAKRLERTLGKNLEFVPRRRQDLDMVFMVAYPDQGRQIKPTLDFLFAGDLPIYATSHIYDGIPNPGKDRDLEGIRFSAMPWTLSGELSAEMEPATTLAPAYRNLFAMGIDAYQLHQWIGLMAARPETELHGKTGRIRLGSGNRLQRSQPWGEFHFSRVRPAPQPKVGTEL